MKQFLPYYERELGFYRRACRTFADQYPKLAGALQMAGEASEDPFTERVIQACAFLNARTAKRLDDDYQKFTESLLQVLHPDYLRPFPSGSIARVDYSGAEHAAMGANATIARGAVLDAAECDNVVCQFRSAYDVTIAPVALTGASFESLLAVLGGDNTILGRGFTLGPRSWRCDVRARLRIGPLNKADFDDFLPGAGGALALKKMMAMFAVPVVQFEVRLVLRAPDVPRWRLGDRLRLGWETFPLSAPEARDRDDVRYEL